MTIQDFQNLPKADVHNHLHLGGMVEKLNKRYPDISIQIPTSYNGLPGMIDFIHGTLNKIMITGEDVINFMETAIESAIADNITLLEASVDLALVRFFDDSVERLIEVTVDLKEKYKSQIDFKPDLGINKDYTLEKVYTDGTYCLKSGVFSGVDLYGKEDDQDLAPFARFYDEANEIGLKTKVHIGEFSDYISINNAIQLLKPNEIQHGIRAVDSIDTMNLILEKNIKLNICPSSNYILGAVDINQQHPIKELFDHGIIVTVSTDDLLLFGATCSDEFHLLHQQGIFSKSELEQIRLNGFD